ncbi:MAG: STAS-like domain-containing protein [Candidatus Sedimenticola sp. (ex Thyasira tokunagai)]
MSAKSEYHLSVIEEFSLFPGGRLKKHGPDSGEEFRDDILIPLFEKYDSLVVDLTGAVTYGSSFLDESFGELGKRYGLDAVEAKLSLIANDDPMLVDTIWEKVRIAAKEYK